MESELMPNGTIEATHLNNSSWHTSNTFSIDDDDVEEGVDFYQMSWFNRSIDLDTVFDADRVVTGVRFRVFNSHLRLEVRVTKFNYQTGKLIDIEHSEWISNNATETKKLIEPKHPDRSTRSKEKSIPIQGKNYYVNFQPTDIHKDVAQSTVPFIDTTPIVSRKPLAGLGLYLKTQNGYGGFIGAKLIVFDASLDMLPINNF
ncbi:uncharacterized protein LOC116339056 [Contarinia nasturtii]|uniref:uncharacterized protein LOC116339056 n=1 Tax=Contarinia nasturtii TaxID=265458 RepID=UPI0012D42A53|nr:uncharacterized protein LOC116339056 [Contarinia nasturtii]